MVQRLMRNRGSAKENKCKGCDETGKCWKIRENEINNGK
jgi:hypothetical protein